MNETTTTTKTEERQKESTCVLSVSKNLYGISHKMLLNTQTTNIDRNTTMYDAINRQGQTHKMPKRTGTQ